MQVTNSGKRPGSEVVQAYVTYPAGASQGEPPMQLKAFTKILLQPAETKEVHLLLPLGPAAAKYPPLSVWDANAHQWSVVKGSFGLAVGGSSCDIQLRGSFTV